VAPSGKRETTRRDPTHRQSGAHHRLLLTLCRVAPTEVLILISSPTVGKERYARYAHECSQGDSGSFVPVNCGALSDCLLENGLFAHGSGPFHWRTVSEGRLVAAAEARSSKEPGPSYIPVRRATQRHPRAREKVPSKDVRRGFRRCGKGH